MQGSNGDTSIENKLVDTVGEEEDGMNIERNIEKYTLPYVKQTIHGNVQYDAGSSNPLFCDYLER